MIAPSPSCGTPWWWLFFALLHTCEGRETTGTTEEPPSSIKVIVSDTSGLHLQEIESVPWKVSSSSTKKNLNINDGDEITIDLDTNQKYQTFDGIGGSFMKQELLT